MVEIGSRVFAMFDIVFLGIAWLLMQTVFIVVAKEIWRMSTDWHGFAGAIVFAVFTTLLWAIALWFLVQRSVEEIREWRKSS